MTTYYDSPDGEPDVRTCDRCERELTVEERAIHVEYCHPCFNIVQAEDAAHRDEL